MNRTQVLVLGFLFGVLVIVAVVRAVAPGVYFAAMGLDPAARGLDLGFLVGLVVFIGALAVGVLRRWRWLFWLLLLAFLAGVLRVPAAVLQMTGVLSRDVPDWYLVVQGALGLAQFGIGLVMITDHRRLGPWGATPHPPHAPDEPSN